jgi:hypothetical protein
MIMLLVLVVQRSCVLVLFACKRMWCFDVCGGLLPQTLYSPSFLFSLFVDLADSCFYDSLSTIVHMCEYHCTQ